MKIESFAAAGIGFFLFAFQVYAGSPSVIVPSSSDTEPSTEITIKKSFWTGWKYSLDGEKYESVGITGASLSRVMEGNAGAQDEMKSYRSRKIWSTIFEGTGDGFITWSVIDWAVGDEDWNNTNSILLGIGIGMSVAGSAIDLLASSHLKQAVQIYNGESSAWNLRLDGPTWSSRSENPVTVSMCVIF